MDTALPQKFPFILNRNLAKVNCTGNHVCTSCDTVVPGCVIIIFLFERVSIFFSMDTIDIIFLVYSISAILKFLNNSFQTLNILSQKFE